jgi:hypothetical protein
MISRAWAAMRVAFAGIALLGLLCGQAEDFDSQHAVSQPSHCCSACHVGHAPPVPGQFAQFWNFLEPVRWERAVEVLDGLTGPAAERELPRAPPA